MTEVPAPVFVVGSMRSGSTMLRLMLDSHPRIAIPSETGFMGAAAATHRIPDWTFGDGWYERLGWSSGRAGRAAARLLRRTVPPLGCRAGQASLG